VLQVASTVNDALPTLKHRELEDFAGRILMEMSMPTVPLCGDGNIGNGICADTSLCCSEFGYCGTGDEFCGKNSSLLL